MRASLFEPKPNTAALILRLGLAAIFIAHGYIKISVGLALIPEVSMAAQRAAGWVELLCGLALVAGLFSRVAALVIIGLQVAAIVMVSGKYALDVVRLTPIGGADFTRVGPEYNLVLIAMCLGVLVLGSGTASLDHLIVSWWRKNGPAQPVAGAV